MDPASSSPSPARSLRTRLVSLAALCVAAAVLLVSSGFSWAGAEREARLEASRLKASASLLAALAEPALERKDRAAALVAVDLAARAPGVDVARIQTLGGLILAQTPSTSGLHALSAGEAPPPSTMSVLVGGALSASALVQDGSRPLGRVMVGGRTEGALQGFFAGLALSLVSALGALALGAAAAMKLRSEITRPLMALARSMREVEVGHDLSQRVEAPDGDEVGLLVASFNRMIEEARQREERIAEHVAGLEAEVAARTADLRLAKDAAEAANSAKSEFMATVSHEIRTPLNGIMVMAEMLAVGDIPPRQRRFAEVIAKSGSSLLAIINDVLDFSKIEAGKLELESIPCDVAEIVDDVCSLFFERAAAKDIDLASYVDPGVPRLIAADPVRLRQVIGNLVNNAIKFTDMGGVLVEAQLVDPRTLRIAVVDSGVGVPADKIKTLFAAFSQADQTTTRRFGGTGLGLAICQRLVGAMNGRFEVKSREGVGSSFAFIIPATALEAAPPAPAAPVRGAKAVVAHPGAATQKALTRYLQRAGYVLAPKETADQDPEIVLAVSHPAALRRAGEAPLIWVAEYADSLSDGGRPQAVRALLDQPMRRCELYAVLEQAARGQALTDPGAAPPAPGAGQAPLPSFSGLKALVADDSPVNREVAVEALQRLGVRAEAVGDGGQAVDAVRRRDFDFVLMDGGMPDMDGYEATRAIRRMAEEEGRPRLPIIGLTAHVMGPLADAWKAADMDGVLHKPFTLAGLAQAVGRFHRPSEALLAPPSLSSPLDPGRPPGKTRLLAGAPGLIDPATAGALADMAKSGRADFVRRIFRLYRENAPLSVSAIENAVQASDWASAASQSHALRSMSLNIGARAVVETAAAIESLALNGERPPEAMLTALRSGFEATLAALATRTPARGDAGGRVEDKRADHLRAALEGDLLRLEYQPRFDRDGRFDGRVEALVRWTDPDGRAGPAADFVALAEECGLMEPLTDWVLQRAMSEIGPRRELSLSCNVSAREFTAPDFVGRVASRLHRTRFEPSRLTLEVTEAAILENDVQVLATMKALHTLAVSLCLDDFGAGYSALLHLRNFPFDELKIDKDFVSVCTLDSQSAALVHAVVSMGRAMGMTVVAEGVETEAQYRFLKLAGVHRNQGYFFSRPLPLAQLDRFIAARERGEPDAAAVA